MITSDDNLKVINEIFSSIEDYKAALKPLAKVSALADYDGKIAAFQKESSALTIEREAALKQLIADREAVREKLQG